MSSHDNKNVFPIKKIYKNEGTKHNEKLTVALYCVSQRL